MTLRPAFIALLALAVACSAPRRDDEENPDNTGHPDAGETTNPPDAGPVDPEKCGNGVVDANEACDPAILEGPGACPTSCDDGSACTTDVLHGTPSLCTARCVYGPVACRSGDGCCPDGCTGDTDSDCGTTNPCGNGVLDGNEACDRAIPAGNPGACPTANDCNDGNICTTDRLTGSAANCTATCTSSPTTTCQSNDGCCPNGCTFATDHDCGGCGNGVVESGETCDGNCPSSCNDFDACTTDAMTGNAAQCNVTCSNTPLTTCQSGDGCCPAGCSHAVDTDCAATSGGLGDPCTADSQCGASGACITESLDGWPGGYCSKTCYADTDCGTGGWCRGADTFLHVTPGYCFRTCANSSACRSGYQCYDRFYEGHSFCAPAGTGNAAVGAPCTSIAQCAGGQYALCMTQAGYGYKDGYCTLELASAGTRTCPSGSHLGNVSGGYGTCFANCTASPQCRGSGVAGYLCYDTDGDGSMECDIGATGTGAIGAACTGVWDCAGWEKGTCGTPENGWPGGYCLLSCVNSTCPSGTNCVQLNTSNAGSKWCLKDCTSNSGVCRTSYTCKDYGTGNTSLRECSP